MENGELITSKEIIKENKGMKSAKALIMIVIFFATAISAESDKRSLLGDIKWRNIGPANMGAVSYTHLTLPTILLV